MLATREMAAFLSPASEKPEKASARAARGWLGQLESSAFSTRDVVPVLTVSGFGSLTGFSNYIDPSSKTDYSGSYTMVRESHTMKFGAMFTRTLKTENALSGTNQGSYGTFSNTVTSFATPAYVRANNVAASNARLLNEDPQAR